MSQPPRPPATFYKLSGAGNDFIAFAEPTRPPRSEEIRAWCRRGLSLGADGVFSITRQSDDSDAVRMHYWNADGERSDLCLNGCRCAARLAFQLTWAETELRLTTDVGPLQARCVATDRIALELPDIVETPIARVLEHDGHAYDGWHLTVGVPHFVLPWPEPLGDAPVATLGAALRRHPDLGSAGANINFVRIPARDRCELRTFERGVEAETLACGTGIVAAVAAGVVAEQLATPVTLLTAGGFEIEARGGGNESWVLEGDARIVATGELQAGAVGLPDGPAWS
ncbi:MAG: diaminopimelate epimerase [Acidobacteriota bacterium]